MRVAKFKDMASLPDSDDFIGIGANSGGDAVYVSTRKGVVWCVRRRFDGQRERVYFELSEGDARLMPIDQLFRRLRVTSRRDRVMWRRWRTCILAGDKSLGDVERRAELSKSGLGIGRAARDWMRFQLTDLRNQVLHDHKGRPWDDLPPGNLR